MIATHPDSSTAQDDAIDLDSLTYPELLEEQATVKAELVKIEAQLADPEGEDYRGVGYRDWRRRALLAHAHFRRELHDIHALLQIKGPEWSAARRALRQQEHAETTAQVVADAAQRRALRQVLPGETPKKPKDPAKEQAHAALIAEHAQRRAAVRAAATEDSLNGLILRLALVVRHLVGDANLPETVTQEDCDALREMGRYLKATYGAAAVKAFLHPAEGGAS